MSHPNHTEEQLAFDKLTHDDDLWKCPTCGSKEVYIQGGECSCKNTDCEIVNADDVCLCEGCGGWEGSAKDLITRSLEKQRCDFVKCEHCNGTGYIKKLK